MKRPILFFLFLMGLLPVANAEKTMRDFWQHAAEIDGGTKFFIKGMTSQGTGMWSFWEKIEKGEAGIGKGDSALLIQKIFLDCRRQRYKVAVMTSYDRDGRVIRGTEGESSWNTITPDTVIEHIQEQICGSRNLFL